MEEHLLRMSNVVRFELPAYADVGELCARIRPRWPGAANREGDVWCVTARVRSTKNDVARLLRAVESYVAYAGLLAIRFQLDGRFYVMEARGPERTVSEPVAA